MKNRKYTIIALHIILLLFSGLPYVKGNAAEMYFRHYNNKHGLSHNTVFCSLQDKRGFMWFGTDDGLNRFDGHSFKVYRYNSYHTNSLPGDRIISLFEDSSGRIWICTNRYMCFYDEESDSFQPFKLSAAHTSPEFFQSVIEDNKQNLWMTDWNRIVRYSPADGSFTGYPAEHYFNPIAITTDHKGVPLIASATAIHRYKPETDSFTSIPVLTDKEEQNQIHISALHEVPEAGILIGTNKAGLKFYSYHDRSIRTVVDETQVRAITPYNSHTYWIGTESGIYIYNVLTQQVTQLQKSLTNEYAIADNAVYSITKDREGGMWVGSFFGGISYLPQEYTGFKRFIGGKTHPQMPGNAVREICPDDYGNIWFGTEDNGINRYNRTTGEITNFSFNNTHRPLSATNIHGLFAEGDKLWVGTYNKGIDVLQLPSGKLTEHFSVANTNNELGSDFILCFHRTATNDFLIGTSTGTLIYNEQEKRFRPWKNVSGLVRQIYSDRKGNIWIATSNGLFRYQAQEDVMHHYTSENNKSSGLGDNSITSVFEDSKGKIWVTTVNGFSQYNDITGLFNRITTENGLPSNIVYRILEDDHYTFWISTANGLVKFNPDTHAMRLFTYTDGLHEAQFNFSSSYKSPDGTMYMGTINGVVAFNPGNFREDPFSPPLYLTGIYVPDNGIGRNPFVTLPVEDMETLRLPYDKSTFTLSYMALSYTSPEAIQYAYMLEGVDKEWVFMNRNKDVTFANLSPGNYTFRVKSTNSSGIWQENEKSLQIVIVPPFWATGWAFLFYGLALCLLIILFYNYKKRKLEEKHRINREIFENKKEKELYNAKIEFFTFITHEIRTPLTLIKAPLEKIMKSEEGSPATRKHLQTIEKNTQRLLDLSNQLLDFRRTESKGFRLNFVHTNISEWLHSIIQRFQPSFTKNNKELKLIIPDKTIYGYIDRDGFTKIVSNLFSNALKYSDRAISVQLGSEAEERFYIRVINDGRLIPENETEKIFSPFYRVKETENIQGSGIGLSLARSLAELHNGSLIYRYAEDKYNEFLLILPLIQEDVYQIEEATVQETVLPDKSMPQDSGKPAILIVEDQNDMRNFISDELSESYQVLEAENGSVALAILKNNTVDLIISDVMMPVMDGFDLCNEVKNNVNLSHIPFILLTAQHNLQSRLKGLNNGADAYMEKPFSIELLLVQVNNLLKNRELLSRAYSEKPMAETVSLAVSPLDELFLDKLSVYLDKNLINKDLNVEALSAEMNMSASSFYRKVKALSGLSPVDFIRIHRLKKAVLLMQAGEKRINEIAFQVGFSSPAYFSTCFHKQYGKSPTEFMKEQPHIL